MLLMLLLLARFLVSIIIIIASEFLRPAPVLDALLSDILASLEDIPALAVLEERVHALEGPPGSLGVEEDDKGDDEDVEAEEQEQRAVSDRHKQEGRNHRHDTVANRPTDY